MRFLVLFVGICFGASIDTFGAIPNTDTPTAWAANSAAFSAAASYANTSGQVDRVILIPGGSSYYVQALVLDHMTNFTLRLDGTLIASNNITAWPTNGNKTKKKYSYRDILTVNSCSYFAFSGYGTIDGQGYDWWWADILNTLQTSRPCMVTMNLCHNFLVENWYVKNSPRFFFYLQDVRYVTMRNMEIYADVDKQRRMLGLGGFLTPDGIPTFPLNTDGIDPKGSDILIENVTITNFDDAVAVKPNNAHEGVLSQCSANILVQNCRVKYSLGMSIGSVPPHIGVACVQNVTFRNIHMDSPIKGVYVKTNPGTQGSGIIRNVTYENIYLNNSLWWGIYIGPQQQKQPGGEGPGCMLYPLEPTCPTQPLITISDIYLINITSGNGLFPPGILRCNSTNPCRDIVLDTVSVFGSEASKNFICENVETVVRGATVPVPVCKTV